jgi:hypothetical protein
MEANSSIIAKQHTPNNAKQQQQPGDRQVTRQLTMANGGGSSAQK